MTTTAVLVHGVGLDHHMWTAFAAVLDRPTRTYDMIGLGEGPRPPGPYTLSQYGEQLAAVVSDERVDVVGFSMGALVAQRFAVDHPARVRRLVLVSAVFDRTPAERAAIEARVAAVRGGGYLTTIGPALERWFTAPFRAQHPDVVETVRQRMLTNDIEAYANAYEVFAHGDAELIGVVDGIKATTLVITGAEDERSTPAMARRLAEALPRGRCIIMPGQRHLVPLEAPVALAQMVRAFLDQEDCND